MSTIKRASVLVILAGLMSTANAGPYDPGLLEFSATGQDMWGGGKGAEPVEKTYSTSWNSSSTLGSITGSAQELIFQPIPGTEAVIESHWHSGYAEDHGNEHKHTSHFFHNHNTDVGWHTTYKEWHSDWDWHDGFWEDHEIFPAIPGTPAVYADTRTGVETVLSTSGSVSVTSSLGFNGGTVDAAVAYDTSLELPDAIGVGEFFNLNPTSAIGDVSLNTQFPKLTGEVYFNQWVQIDAFTTSFFIGAGSTTHGGSLVNINFGSSILKINTDDLPDDTMSVFGLDDLAFDVTKGIVYVDLLLHEGGVSPVITLPFLGPRVGVGINLGDITLDYPDFNTSGSLNPDGKSVVSSGTVDNIVRINADLDAAAILHGKMNLPLGGVTKLGPVTFRGDLLDIDVGPTIDLSQDFELTPTLMVDLEFDHPVLTESGVEIDSWSGAFGDIPDFALHDEHPVVVTPTYWLDAELDNQTTLEFDMTFSLDVLKGSITVLGFDSVAIEGPVVLIDLDYPLFSMGSADVFNESFGFSGFNRFTTDSFVLAANSPSYVVYGSNRSETGSGGSGSDPEPTPEPATVALLGIGLAILTGAELRRRLKKKAVDKS